MRLLSSPRIAHFAAPAVLGASLLGGMLAQAPATHADDWCFDDPIVLVQGHLLDIRTGLPAANLLTMRSTSVVVVIPSNTSGAVVLNDISAFPMTTTISPTGPAWSGAGPIPVTIQALVTADVSYPVELTATPLASLLPLTVLGGAASTTGTTNTPISLAITLPQ